MNRRLVTAIAISLFINIVLSIFLLDLMKFDFSKKEDKKNIPIKLKYSKLNNDISKSKPIEQPIKEKPKGEEIKPIKKPDEKKVEPKVEPKPKEIQKIKPQKKKPIIEPKEKAKKDISIPKTSKKESIKEKQTIQKKPIKDKQEEQKIPRSGLAGALSKPTFEQQVKKIKSPSDRMMESLYTQKELSEISNTQKKFLKENLDNISKITQYYLNRVGYPAEARRMRATGLCVMEFYLYPDGYISDIKIKKSSGYKSLDDNSVFVVEIAHRRYPKPREKTLIRMFVHYTP